MVCSFLDVRLRFYDDISDLLLTCQLAAIIEVINPLVGIVKTGVTAPLMQVILFNGYFCYSGNRCGGCHLYPCPYVGSGSGGFDSGCYDIGDDGSSSGGGGGSVDYDGHIGGDNGYYGGCSDYGERGDGSCSDRWRWEF